MWLSFGGQRLDVCGVWKLTSTSSGAPPCLSTMGRLQQDSSQQTTRPVARFCDSRMADEEVPKPTVQWSGAWDDRYPTGKGVMTYPPAAPQNPEEESETEPVGDKFEGKYVAGCKTGHGRYTWANGCYYDGQYANDQKQGHGVMTYPDGSRYEGNFENDGPNGTGMYYYANGDIYLGEVRSEASWTGARQVIKSGQGSYYHKETESEYIGTWQDGRLVGGQWVLKDGSRFEGEFDASSLQLTFSSAASGLMQCGSLGAASWKASSRISAVV
ncbi:hypothetical protein WJX72_010324 [[Myrmecia] bisecta]|uniref:MORN repeat-containing protein n=1 Tax=[Myrmecia] bisecta TaxID=41462 RepID=A0AAW1PUI8_9CHLO